MRPWKRLLHLVRRRRFEADLAEELRLHRELAEDAARRAGAAPDEARREAALAFGNVALTLEDSRAVWRFTWLESLAQDICYALRGFRKSPGFALTAIGTLALGLGILAASFSVFSALVLRPYAVRDPHSLYSFTWAAKGYTHHSYSLREFTELRRSKAVFSDVLAYVKGEAAMAGRGSQVQAVSGNYFSMLGAAVCMGRPLVGADDTPGGPGVAVATYDTWQNRFHFDPNALGKTLRLRGRPVELVGVACPGFTGMEGTRVEFWVSLPLSGALVNGPDLFGPEQWAGLQIIGRLKPGMTPEAAKAALLSYGRQVSANWVDGTTPDRVLLKPRATALQFNSGVATTFLPLFAVFGLILLIACANVSNMMLARALARRREMGIRISLGAGRGRLLRQLLTESLLLAALAALGAFAVASATIKGALWIMLNGVPAELAAQARFVDFSPDLRVLAFLFAAAAAATLAFGFAPAVQATRGSLIQANRGEFANDYRPARLRNALVVVQVTVCALLLISASTAVRSERLAASQVLVGLDSRGVFGVVSAEKFRGPIAARLRLEPLLESLGATGSVSLHGFKTGQMSVPQFSVSPEYFSIFRIPLLRGRNFSAAEADGQGPVAIVSETAAKRLWPRQEPLGQVIQQPFSQPGDRRRVYRAATVVGIARDVVYDIGSSADAAFAYFPTSPKARNGSTLLVRMKGDSTAARRIIEAAVEQVAPSAADMILPMDKALDLRFFMYRLVSRITGFLGGLALLLTVSGIYGVLSYLVSQRKREFGIRMALGAEAGGIAAMVLRQSLRLAAAGAAIGAALALGLAKLLAHAIQPITAFDPVGYAGGLLVVIAAALVAAWLPAQRAVRVNPAVTLRSD